MLPNHNDPNFNAGVTQQHHSYYGEEADPALAAMIAANSAKSGCAKNTVANDDSFFDGKRTRVKPSQPTKKSKCRKINSDSSSIDTDASNDHSNTNVPVIPLKRNVIDLGDDDSIEKLSTVKTLSATQIAMRGMPGSSSSSSDNSSSTSISSKEKNNHPQKPSPSKLPRTIMGRLEDFQRRSKQSSPAVCRSTRVINAIATSIKKART